MISIREISAAEINSTQLSMLEISDISSLPRLIIFGQQDRVSIKPLDLDAKCSLGMQSIQTQNPSFHRLDGK